VNIVLWVVQALVAAIFVFSGVTKGIWSREKLVASGQTGPSIVPMWLLRPVALLEVLGALGLLLPRLFDIAVWLTPVAAVGLAIVMVGAIVIHLRLKEPKTAFANFGILLACLFIAFGRS
jgi:uncharacterized membrane protein YphA (DoxX/SURF4 family)